MQKISTCLFAGFVRRKVRIMPLLWLHQQKAMGTVRCCNDYNLKNTITFPFQDHTKTFLFAVKEVFFMFINDQLCRNNTKQSLINCQFKTCFRYIKMLCYKEELTNYVYFPYQAHK